MFKLVLCISMMVACTMAAPSPNFVGVAAPIVTATSSQVVARNYNAAFAVAAPIVAAAPLVRAAPLVAAPAFAAPAFAAPAYAAHAFAAPALASPYSAYSSYPYYL